MTLEEFKKIRDQVFAEIKKKRKTYPYLYSIVLRGAVQLATAVEKEFKEAIE